MPSLTSIAEDLLVKARQIDAYLEQNHLPEPSFDNDVLMNLPAELEAVRTSMADGSNDLKNLIRGPVGMTMDIALNWTDFLPLRIIYHYKLAYAVPLDGEASYEDIAQISGLRRDLVFRFLRAGMSNHFFDENPVTGRVRHTAASRLLVTNTGLADSVGLQTEELGPAGSRLVDAWDKWGQDTKEPNRTAFALVNETNGSIFDVLAKNPERGRRFNSSMRFYTSDYTWDLRHILSAYDWKALDRSGALVVDVGGGNGQVSQFLARNTNKLSFLVQDLPHVVPSARDELPAELKGRVEFAVHSFLERQKLSTSPDAFLLRWILHDWPDAYCVRIMQSLVPAMRPGTKVLIYEYVLDDAPVRDLNGRVGLQLDMIVSACFNGQERRRADFEKLLALSDERFVLETIRKPEGSTMSLVEVTWKA